MPWYHNIVPESIKKNVCAYLLQRYFGQFFEEKIRRDQLNVDLYNGTGSVEDISLDIQALNELSEKQNWPMEFVDGYLEKLNLRIPWTSILKDPSYVEVKGLKITLQPKQRHESATSMFESMWNSMTSSMQLAEECAKQEASNAAHNTQPFEGIELFAQTIDSILSRVRVKFIDTVIQIEHVPKESITGVGITINIDLIEYSDEAGNDPTPEEATDLTSQDNKKAYLVESFTTKKMLIHGITLSTVEFASKARTFSRSLLLSQSQQFDDDNDDSVVTILQNSTINDNNGDEKVDEIRSTTPIIVSQNKTPVENQENLSQNGHRHVIVFGKISSVQEIRIKLKQSENLIGPKVSLDINFGSFTFFLSPRQFHVLVELANGLASPDMEDTSNIAPRTKCTAKPMSGLDYQRVEHELQQQLQPLNSFKSTGVGLQSGQGWSTAAFDESDTEDNFLPMRNAMSGMYDSTMSGISSSMESSFNSTAASSVTEHTQRTKRRFNNIDSDPTAEISHFQIRLASLALIILHEDLLVQPAEKDHVLALSSVQQMQRTAGEFFDKLGHFVLTAYADRDFANAKDVFDKACSHNHLRLLAAPLQIEADEKTTMSAFSITGQLSIAKMQIAESSYSSEGQIEWIPLLTFIDTTPTSQKPPTTINIDAVKPSLRLTFKHVERTSKNCGGSGRRNSGPRTDISLTLNKCNLEVDITIIDRITALLNPPTICVIEKQRYNPWGNCTVPAPLEPIITVESRMDLKVTSPSINLRLRFPVPDFRPAHDMNRIPWWKRNVRPDYLLLVLSDALFQATFQTGQTYREYIIQSRGLDIIYYETENSVALPIAKAGLEEKYVTSMQDVLLHTRLCIKIFPVKSSDLDESTEIEQDPMTTSCYGAFENQNNQQPGPFGAKKVVHQSDTPHSKPLKDDSEELIIPGDKAELDEFIKSTSSCAKIEVDLFFPTVSLQLKSKHIYELIYNRINNDLLLWTPSAPKPKQPLPSVYESLHFSNYGGTGGFGKNVIVDGPFSMCKSGIQYESECDTDDSDDGTSNNIFYSTYDNRMKFPSKSNQSQIGGDEKTHTSPGGGQSNFVLSIHIGQGVLCINPPVREATSNNVIPGQQGEFMMNLEDANVFVVSGYKGDASLGFVCAQVHNAQLYHCDMHSIPSQPPPLKEFGTSAGKHLHATIYKSETGMLADSKNHGGNREMFTVAVKIQARHETHHVKTVQVAMGLNKCTLRHRMCNEPNTWISHLLDFFNVHDYPISSYHAKDVLTELHVHLWDCAIDYRPLYLPLRSAITIGTFSLSSHLSSQANSSTLRFIFEECGLFLSEKAPPRNGIASIAPVDLRRDYVNVIELGLFELSLKTNDKKSGINPHIDLRASNNSLNIHTCSDSGKMLLQLISYIAGDGDLTMNLPTVAASPSSVATASSAATSPYSSPLHHRRQSEHELLIPVETLPQDISNLSESQHEHVNNLLGEAMKESEIFKAIPEEQEMIISAPAGAKIFFFPDEDHFSAKEPAGKPPAQVSRELGDVQVYHQQHRPLSSNYWSSDTDEEFCIIDSEDGLGLYPKDGIPEIKWLTTEPIRLVDNHFTIPVGRTDLLKPPDHFPTPIYRYTLRDMSITWHMYGGNDFKQSDSGDNKKKSVNFSDSKVNDVVSFSNSHKSGTSYGGGVTITCEKDKKKAALPWNLRGGVNRDHSVHMELQLNKVRFQHEVYPDSTKQASRQVLIISDVEVTDRLETSEINKFLYQYTSQARPRQSHAHMVVIKAIHIRPDPKLITQECCLKISLLPLRLNIDQDALLFLMTFFTQLGSSGSFEKSDLQVSSKQSTPTHQPPVMTVSEKHKDEIRQEAHKVVNENLIMLIEENKYQKEKDAPVSSTTSSISDDSPIYFRNVIFSPDVLIRLDYTGKRVDMTHGSIPGLLMGLGQLNCSELRLKRVSYRHGLLGFDKLLAYLLQEWLNDIKKNQLPSLLGGVGPMHSFVKLFQGVRDLFWMPFEQYQKDGRIVRGLQRGANSFTTSTALAALELTSRIIHLIQITAETAYDMLSPGPSVRRVAKSKGKRKKYNKPQDIREGMTNALMLVREGIGETADNIVQVASHEKEQKGYTGAVGGVLRQIPPTILKPIIIASEATSNVLGGMCSQLVPDARMEANQKWRSDDG